MQQTDAATCDCPARWQLQLHIVLLPHCKAAAAAGAGSPCTPPLLLLLPLPLLVAGCSDGHLCHDGLVVAGTASIGLLVGHHTKVGGSGTMTNKDKVLGDTGSGGRNVWWWWWGGGGVRRSAGSTHATAVPLDNPASSVVV
jgi:hypothetical protein